MRNLTFSKYRAAVLFFFILCFSSCLLKADGNTLIPLHAQPTVATDSLFVEEILADSSLSLLTTGDAVVKIGQAFLNRPYVSGTLEVNAPDELLVVNTREVDCTTFVDQVLALVWAAHDACRGYADFCLRLQRLRYQGGHVNGYASRCHYFTQYLSNGTDECPLFIPVKGDGMERRAVTLNFMSTHPDSYVQLRDDSVMLSRICTMEQDYTSVTLSYFPDTQEAAFYRSSSSIHDGDILSLVTTVDGLDVSHLGIAVWVGDELHLLNASSRKGKVILDAQPLREYLLSRKSCPGILAHRIALPARADALLQE